MVPLSRSGLILLSSCKAHLKQGGKYEMPKFGVQALSALPDTSKPSILQFLVPLLSARSSKAAPVWMVALVSTAPAAAQGDEKVPPAPPHHAGISHQIILFLPNIRSQPGFSQGTL